MSYTLPIIQLKGGEEITPRFPINDERVRYWQYANECDRIFVTFIPGARFRVCEVCTHPGKMWIRVLMPGRDPASYLKITGEEYARMFSFLRTAKPGVTGAIVGLKPELVSFLDSLGTVLGLTFQVTDGKRDGPKQAMAMFDRWDSSLKKDGIPGGVYGPDTLAIMDRNKLTHLYRGAFNQSFDQKEREKLKAEFLALASKVTKSEHLHGQAVDLARSSVNDKALTILKRHLRLSLNRRTLQFGTSICVVAIFL
jgi:hypothetical protein